MSLRHPALRWRTMIAFGLLGLVVSAAIAALCFAVTRSTLVSNRERTAERQVYLNARAVRASLGASPTRPGDALSVAQTSSEGVALLQTNGSWFGTSVSADPDAVPPELLQTVDDGDVGRQRTQLDDATVVAVGVPLREVDAIYVELVPMGDLERTLEDLGWALVVAAVATSIVATGAGWAASAQVLRPLRRIAEAANHIREGSLDRRLAADGDDDLQPLVHSFNDMVSGLQQRIERESRFASDVSHELRSPLATMAAALSVARRRAEGPAALEALDLLDHEVGHFNELIDQLLEIGRAEAGVAELVSEPVEPETFVRMVLATTHNEVPVTVGPGAGEVAVLDKRRMAQAVVNLLDNAGHHGGGATGVHIDGTTSTLSIAVEDAGPGVPEHERSHVFARFARGRHTKGPGTGLGLALVREHVRLHGGHVEIGRSAAGGARFTITVPRGTAP